MPKCDWQVISVGENNNDNNDNNNNNINDNDDNNLYFSQLQDLIFAVALRFKDYTFHASGHRVESQSIC